MISKVKILIIDDNPAARAMARFYLSEMADEIRECDDGADALAAYADFLPDWVLMDWEMKQIDGLTATQHIIRYFPDAKILMVTNYDETDLRQAAADAGAIGFVPKDDLIALQSFLRRAD